MFRILKLALFSAVAALACTAAAHGDFAAAFSLAGDAPDPAHVFPLTPLVVTLWDTQGYGTTPADNSITRIQLNWTDSAPALTTGSTWTWSSALSGLGLAYDDSDMSDRFVVRMNLGDEGVIPGTYFSVGTLAFTAPAYNSGGVNIHALDLNGGLVVTETMTLVACGAPAIQPGDVDGVWLMAPPNGTGLTLFGYNITIVPGGFWTGATNTQWQTGTNWSSHMTPDGTFEAVFAGALTTQPALTKDEAVKSVEFRTGGWNIGGPTHTLTVGPGGISSAGSTTNTINPTVNFTGPAAINVGPENTLVLAAVTAGSNGLTKSGAGTLVLAGAGDYSGGTTVSEGTLLVNNASGSGTGTGTVTVGAATLGGTGFINGPVTLTDDSTLTSTGTLTIKSTLTVQGLANQLAGGTVNTSGDVTIDPGAVFIINGTLGGEDGSLIVRGTLMGKGTINKTCIIDGGVLSPGEASTIQGMSQILNAAAPRNFAFEIGATTPNYATPSNSVNDVIRLTDAATPFADATGAAPAALTADTVIDVYFLWSDPALGEYKAEFFAATDFSDAIAGATYQYWHLDPRGSRYHNGNFYSPLDESLVDWSVVPETATFGGATASGYITEFAVVPEPATLALLALGGLALLSRRRK